MFVHCTERFSDFGEASLLRALQGLRTDIFQFMMHSGIDQGAELIRVFSFPAVDPMRQPVREDRDIPQDDLLGCRQRLQHDDALCFLFAREEEGVRNLLLSLEETLVEDSPVLLAIETMAGKGGELGSTLEGVQKIIDGYSHPERLAVCLDTCHLSDAGYDVSDLSGLKGEIERTVGLSRVKAIHLNDSKNPRGSRKDRHANLGQGYIGFDTLSRWAHDPDFAAVPKILETPYFEGKPPYKKEIEMLRSNSYDPDFLSKL